MQSPQTPTISRRSLVAGIGAAAVAVPRVQVSASGHQMQNLWPSTIGALLQQDLWTDRDAYDASHNLMVPMHLAFSSDTYRQWQEEFNAFFDRLTLAWRAGEFLVESSVNRGQFVWMASRYLRIKGETSTLSESNLELLQLIIEDHAFRLRGSTVSIRSDHEFAHQQEAIEWKLSDPDVDHRYYASVTDSYRFTLSIGADLFAMQNIVEMPPEVYASRELGLRVLRERSSWGEDGGWRFHHGWSWDHPDYAYAGHHAPFEGMEPAPVEGIAEDSSHHHRLPLILDSFDPGDLDADVSAEIDEMRDGLAIQFVNHVLVFPDEEFPGLRTRNYMDGNNGLYRWNYETTGENNGYLPYQLSSTVALGWWALLPNETIQEAYGVLAGRFPLSQEEIDLYVGPNTSRERNPLFVAPDNLYNGMKEITVLCALELGKIRSLNEEGATQGGPVSGQGTESGILDLVLGGG